MSQLNSLRNEELIFTSLLSILKKYTESPEKELERLSQEVDINIEMISDVPVFTIETNDSKAILKITQHYGQKAVFRIINANFVPIALEFGTDKGRVEEHDFRIVADGSGYDVWGVEKKPLALWLASGCKSRIFA